MDQQEANPLHQKVEVIVDQNTEKNQTSQIEEESDDDQLIPRPAFQIDLNNQNLTEEEKDAMHYLLIVRNQKQSLILGKRQVNKNGSAKVELESKQRFEPTIEFQNNINQENQQMAIQAQIRLWKDQLLSNWRCVVSNLQYVHKQKRPENLFREKFKDESLFDIPEAHTLCCNKWLTLPQIQALMIDYSALYMEILDQAQSKHKRKAKYHLWVYSLLALHQSYASYTNFEALGSINACIQRQFQHFRAQSQQKQKQAFQSEVVEWLTTVLILKQAFKQRFLVKYLSLLKRIKLI